MRLEVAFITITLAILLVLAFGCAGTKTQRTLQEYVGYSFGNMSYAPYTDGTFTILEFKPGREVSRWEFYRRSAHIWTIEQLQEGTSAEDGTLKCHIWEGTARPRSIHCMDARDYFRRAVAEIDSLALEWQKQQQSKILRI